MTVQLPVQMDQPTFLAWVEGREERYELDRGRVIMMTGRSRGHWQIAFNLAKALDARLDAKRFAVLPEFGVALTRTSVRFPDVVVDVAGETAGDLAATAPTIIAEVLSPSSERIDLGDKAAEYLRLPTLLAYLVFAQDEMKAWVWIRRPNEPFTAAEMMEGEQAVVRIEHLGIELPFAEVYDRMRLK